MSFATNWNKSIDKLEQIDEVEIMGKEITNHAKKKIANKCEKQHCKQNKAKGINFWLHNATSVCGTMQISLLLVLEQVKVAKWLWRKSEYQENMEVQDVHWKKSFLSGLTRMGKFLILKDDVDTRDATEVKTKAISYVKWY